MAFPTESRRRLVKLDFRERPRPRRSGFTLVEILVAVAILAVLVAVALPSLANARKQADHVVALTRLRQIGGVVLENAADNNQSIIAESDPSSGLVWLFQLEKLGYTDGLTARAVDPNQAFQNPITARLHPGNFSTQNSGGFGLNAFSNIKQRMPLAQISRPAETILAADANWHSGSSFDFALSDVTSVLVLYPNTLSYGYAHYLFCDGHVEQLQALNPTSPNSPPVGYKTHVFFHPAQYVNP